MKNVIENIIKKIRGLNYAHVVFTIGMVIIWGYLTRCCIYMTTDVLAAQHYILGTLCILLDVFWIIIVVANLIMLIPDILYSKRIGITLYDEDEE